jgi:hypothetical protein
MKNQEIADQTFKDNKDADKVFVCDGFPFLTENAANLHKNTSGKKDLKVFPFARAEESTPKKKKKKKVTAPATEPVALDKLKLAELQAVATKELIRFEEKATRAELIKLINDSKESKNQD